tara:strand:- start:46714 stop:47424 length:711 start_codon:yes stop_codon:yes gene_type:complete
MSHAKKIKELQKGVIFALAEAESALSSMMTECTEVVMPDVAKVSGFVSHIRNEIEINGFTSQGVLSAFKTLSISKAEANVMVDQLMQQDDAALLIIAGEYVLERITQACNQLAVSHRLFHREPSGEIGFRIGEKLDRWLLKRKAWSIYEICGDDEWWTDDTAEQMGRTLMGSDFVFVRDVMSQRHRKIIGPDVDDEFVMSKKSDHLTCATILLDFDCPDEVDAFNDLVLLTEPFRV